MNREIKFQFISFRSLFSVLIFSLAIDVQMKRKSGKRMSEFWISPKKMPNEKAAVQPKMRIWKNLIMKMYSMLFPFTIEFMLEPNYQRVRHQLFSIMCNLSETNEIKCWKSISLMAHHRNKFTYSDCVCAFAYGNNIIYKICINQCCTLEVFHMIKTSVNGIFKNGKFHRLCDHVYNANSPDRIEATEKR